MVHFLPFSYLAHHLHQMFQQMLRPLSKQWQEELDAKQDLWELASHDLLCDYYKMTKNEKGDTMNGSEISDRPIKRAKTSQSAPPRRSGRLRPSTHKEKYIHSYNLLMSRNESAVLQLQEHAHSNKKPLSLSILKRLLKEYQPIAINRRVRTGGTFLVEVVRARYVKESVILKCIKELVENNAFDLYDATSSIS